MYFDKTNARELQQLNLLLDQTGDYIREIMANNPGIRSLTVGLKELEEGSHHESVYLLASVYAMQEREMVEVFLEEFHIGNYESAVQIIDYIVETYGDFPDKDKITGDPEIA